MISVVAVDSGYGYNCEKFDEVFEWAANGLLDWGRPVDTGHWQALKDVPHVHTLELMNVLLVYPIPRGLTGLQGDVKPNLPFAEAQFQERVGGEPLNPPPSYKLWPWAKASEDHLTVEESKFSHSYPERMWPPQGQGVRYPFGNLEDVVRVLANYPGTRQAYMPMFEHEDLHAITTGERAPCSLGWQFLRREGKLHINYHMRSCDLLRYFRDDAYMTCRLAQWMRDRLDTKELEMGTLTMFMGSLHVFEGDRRKLEREYAS